MTQLSTLSAPATIDLDAVVRDVDLDALLHARHPDPFRALGVRVLDGRQTLRVFVPGGA